MTPTTPPNSPASAEQALADIEFLKDVVSDHSPAMRSMGIIYGSAGLLYGGQCLINWLVNSFWPTAPTLVHLAHGFLPTVIFLAINFIVATRSDVKGFGSSVVQRSINAAFTGAGIANIMLAIVFGIAAYTRNDFSIWLFFPVTVCALQGAVWFAAAMIRRRWWMGAVAAGWFIAVVSAGLVVQDPSKYIIVIGLAMLLCMALPGYILMRINEKA